MIPHEHDEDGNCIPPENGFYAQELPTWRFSIWDVVGIGFFGIANVLTVTGNAFGLLSRECAAMANWTRQNHDLKVAEAQRKAADEAHLAHQRQMAETLRGIVEGPEDQS